MWDLSSVQCDAHPSPLASGEVGRLARMGEGGGPAGERDHLERRVVKTTPCAGPAEALADRLPKEKAPAKDWVPVPTAADEDKRTGDEWTAARQRSCISAREARRGYQLRRKRSCSLLGAERRDQTARQLVEQEQPICEVLSSAAEAAMESVAIGCCVELPLPCGTARVDAWSGAAKIDNMSVDGAVSIGGGGPVLSGTAG